MVLVTTAFVANRDVTVVVTARILDLRLKQSCMGRALVHRYGAVGAGVTLSVTYGVILTVLSILTWRMAVRSSPDVATHEEN